MNGTGTKVKRARRKAVVRAALGGKAWSFWFESGGVRVHRKGERRGGVQVLLVGLSNPKGVTGYERGFDGDRFRPLDRLPPKREPECEPEPEPEYAGKELVEA